MLQEKKVHPKEKTELHLRNRHRNRYDFNILIKTCPELEQFVKLNIYDDESIDFSNPKAVMALNKALLKHYYDIENWDIPDNYLCPPIPGRADYIHYMADLLQICNNGIIPIGNKIKCLDIGVGSNCIYPIIGIKEYGWSFVGSDIDSISIESSKKIVESNPSLSGKIELRLQQSSTDVFDGIIQKDELFDLSICNPPFHSSFQEAQASTIRKINNLNRKQINKPLRNFGGQNTELWCEGGELQFVRNMIIQSKQYSNSCCWFSTIISKQSNLNSVFDNLEKSEVYDFKTISIGQGNKISRIVAWTFLTDVKQKEWVAERWQ